MIFILEKNTLEILKSGLNHIENVIAVKITKKEIQFILKDELKESQISIKLES